MSNQPTEFQVITTANKNKEGEMKTSGGGGGGNVFSTKLGNSDIVADLEIDVRLKIGDNTELIKSNENNNIDDSISSSNESNDGKKKNKKDSQKSQ